MGCTLARTTSILPEPCVVLKLMRKPVCFAADRTGANWGLCFWECCLGLVYLCVFEWRKRWKNAFFTAYRPIFSPTILRFAYWPLSTWISHFEGVCALLSVLRPISCGYSHCLFMSVSCVLPCFACACSPDEIASPPPPPPRPPPPPPPLPSPPPNVISLPLGPWQTHQTGRK